MKIPCHNDDICLPVSVYEPSDAAHCSKKVYSVGALANQIEKLELYIYWRCPGVETASNKHQGLRQKLLVNTKVHVSIKIN